MYDDNELYKNTKSSLFAPDTNPRRSINFEYVIFIVDCLSHLVWKIIENSMKILIIHLLLCAYNDDWIAVKCTSKFGHFRCFLPKKHIKDDIIY